MPGWPSGKFHRKTQHAKPRYQLYQPGFNSMNGCWLDGTWITVPKDEWDRRKNDHDRMYSAARTKYASQHYRDAGVAPEAMTPAQRQAWERNAGNGRFDAVWPDGRIQPLELGLAANKISAVSERWLRNHGAKLLRWVVGPGRKKKPINQLTGFNIPDDLVSTERGTTENDPVDTWQHVVDQNVAGFDDMFEGCIQELEKAADNGIQPSTGFAAQMAFQRIIELEEEIIRMEWNETRGEKDEFQTIPDETRRYVRLRARLRTALDAGSFKDWYEQARTTHNKCARTNLDNTEGRLYCFVLPKFYEDGSHDPWGPHDVPWGNQTTQAPA
jgi:hypothetical protein